MTTHAPKLAFDANDVDGPLKFENAFAIGVRRTFYEREMEWLELKRAEVRAERQVSDAT